MRSSLIGVEAKYADAIAVAVLEELLPYGIDESRVELTGHGDADVPRVLSVGVIVDGAESSPMLLATQTFKTSRSALDGNAAWRLFCGCRRTRTVGGRYACLLSNVAHVGDCRLRSGIRLSACH
jgi:hypothetical protein